MSRMQRVGLEELPRHLETTYRTRVVRIEELDRGTYRVERAEGPSWIARLFPAERPLDQTRGDAEILRVLAELEFPAERCAAPDPVSVLEGQAVLVTEFVPGVPRAGRREAIRNAGGLAALGWLLGRLHTLPSSGATARPGGAWHHLADGPPGAEIAALGRLLDDAERPVDLTGVALYETLKEQVRALDDGGGLPECFVHPDFVLANVVAPPTGGLVLVDWTGAGQAARAWSLAFLLWSVGFAGDLLRVDRIVAGYRRHVIPEPDELERLEALIRVRPTVFNTWAFCTGRKTLAEAAASITANCDAAAAIADRARSAFTSR